MKKITGLMAILVAGAALAAPAMARDRDDYNCAPNTYNTYNAYNTRTAVRRDVRDVHTVRRDVRPFYGRAER
jgi:hypothetical protein